MKNQKEIVEEISEEFQEKVEEKEKDDDNTSVELQARPVRYCGGRFSGWERNFLIFLMALNLILIIMIPVAYFCLIPRVIQSTLDGLGESASNRVILKTFSIGDFHDSSLDVGVDLELPAVVPLPVRAGIGSTPVRVTDQSGNVIAETSCPPLDFWVNSAIGVSVLTNVTFAQETQQNLQNLLGQLAAGVPDLQITIHLKAPITVFGMTLYSGLDLYKTLDLGSLETSVASLVGLLDRIADSISPASFQSTGDLLASKFSVGDVIALAHSFSAVWSNLSLELTDSGFTSDIEFALENGSPFQVTSLPGADFYVELQGTPIARVIAHQLSLKKGYQSLNIKVDVLFLDEKLQETSFSTALERASLSYALFDDFVVSIVGPVTMPQASFIQTVTDKFRFDIPLSQLLALNIGGNLAFSDILSAAGVQSILGNSTIGLQVDSNQINVPLDLALPNLAPIPRKFNFPYTTSLAVAGQSVSLMNVVLNPLAVSRTDVAISVNTSLHIVPVNSDAAATDLALSINPILALKPSPGSVKLSSLVFTQNGQAGNYSWPRVLFGKGVGLHLPPLNKTWIVDQAVSLSQSTGITKTLSNLASIQRFQVAQLDSAPGFGVDGVIDVIYPSGAPHVQVDVGYVGVKATLQSSVLSSLEMPGGVAFFPKSEGTGIKAVAHLDSTDRTLTEKMQKVVDRVVEGNGFDEGQYAGITGFLFGSSPASYFVTFGKVVVDISLSDLGNIAGHLGGGALIPTDTTLARIESADIQVSSSHLASIAVGASVNNPSKIGLGVGTVGLKVELDRTTLLEIELAPISLAGRNAKQSLVLAIKSTIHSSESGSAEKLASLVTDYSNSNTASRMSAGIVGLTMQGTSASSKIEMFSGVHINLAVGSLVRLLGKTSSYSNLVDLSPIIPTTDQLLSYTHPFIKYGMVDTSIGQGRMKVGADVEYHNVVPVSLNVPYGAAEISLGGVSAFVAQVSGIRIDRTTGTIRPRIDLLVKNGPGVAENVGALVNQLMNEKPLDTHLQISKIYFGNSPSDQNDLFSALSLDISQLVHDLSKPFIKVVRDNSALLTLNGLAKRDSDPWTFSLLDFVDVKVEKLDLAFSGDNDLKTTVGATIGLPFPVDLNIPFISMKALLEDAVVVSPTFGLVAKGANPVVNLEVASAFTDSDELADQIAKLVDVLINGGSSSQHFGIESLVLGASSTDNIAAFSKVVVGVPADIIIKPAHDEIMKLLGGSVYDLLKSLDLSVGAIKVGAAPNHACLLDTPISFTSKLALSLSGLKYVGISVGLEGSPLTNVELDGFSLVTGVNKQPLSVKAAFPSSENIQNQVARFATDLRGHLGQTGQIFRVGGLLFGSNPQKPFKFLSRAAFNIASSRLFTQDTVDYFSKMLFPTGKISLLDSVKLDGAAIDFQPNKAINAGLTGSTTTNVSLAVSLPFVSLGSKLDSTDAFDIALTDLKLAGTGPLDIHTSLSVHDSDPLADGIAGLVDDIVIGRTIKGKIGAERLLFGVSSSDYVDTFSKVSLDFELEGLLRPILKQPLNITSLLDRLAISLSGMEAKTAVARSLDLSLSGKLQNGFSLSLNNLGFFGLSAGLDSNDPIATVSGAAPNIKQGQNELAVQTNVKFASTPESKKKVASLAHEIYNNGLGGTKENITATGLLFGISREASFKFLSKAALSVASSSILTPDLKVYLLKLLGVGQGGRLFDLFSFSKAVVDGSSDPQSVNFDLALAIKSGGIRTSIQIGHLDADVNLNEKLLLTSKLTNGVTIGAGSSNGSAEVSGKALFSNDESLQSDVNNIVTAAFSSKPLPGSAGILNVQFGMDSNPDNIIDLFSEISLTAQVDDAYTALGLSSIHIPTIYDVVPASLELDVFDPVTLLADWALQVGKVSDSIHINLPYLYLGTYLDDRDFMDLSFSRVSINGGRIEGTVYVKFTEEAAVNQALVGSVADILFHRASQIGYNHSLSFNGLEFGPNLNGAVKALSKVHGQTPVEEYIHQASSYFDRVKPADFVDIAAQMVPEGVDINCLIKPLPFPIGVKFKGIDIDIGWQVDGVGNMYEALHVQLDSINLPAFHVKAIPDLDPVNGGFEPLTNLLIDMFQFKEFLGNARFKKLVLVGSGGARFRTYQETIFAAPPSFYIPDPMYVELLPYQLPLEIAISVRNPTSLHLDLGRAEINITDSDSGDALISANTAKDVIAYNINEGGNGTANGMAPTVALLSVPVFNIGDIFLDLPKLVVRLLTHAQASTFAVDVHLYRDGRDITWVATATQYMVNHGLLGKFQAILGTVLAHVKISIGSSAPPLLNAGGGNGTRSSLMEMHPSVKEAVDSYWKPSGGIPPSLVIKGH